MTLPNLIRAAGFLVLLLSLVVSAGGWAIYGAFVGSVSQVAFSVAYATLSLFGVWRLRRRTHA